MISVIVSSIIERSPLAPVFLLIRTDTAKELFCQVAQHAAVHALISQPKFKSHIRELIPIEFTNKPKGESSDFVRIAVDSKIITLDGIETLLPESKRGKVTDILDLIGYVMSKTDPLDREEYKAANEYITRAVCQIQREYEGVELENLNDVRYVRDKSKTFSDYLKTLSEEDSEPLKKWYAKAKERYGILEIHYSEELKVIKRDGRQTPAHIKQLFTFEGLGRAETETVRCGDLCAIVGIQDIDISKWESSVVAFSAFAPQK